MRISMGWVKHHVEGRKVVQRLLHDANELGLGSCALPFIAWIQGDEDVRQLDSHGIRCDLRRSDAAPDVMNLVREFVQEKTLDLAVVGGGFIDRDTGEANRVDDDRSFGELRNKLSTEPGRDERRRCERAEPRSP